MTHPSPSTLALYAGQDLGWFAHRRTERHLSHCPYCRSEVESFVSVREELAASNELPALPWNRMAAEMRANIRLGLEAGECVRGKSARLEWITGPHAWLAYAGMVVLLGAGLLLERPAPPPQPVAAENAVLRVTADGIEVNQGGQSMGLGNVSGRDVSYSASAQGSIRARFVDDDTGNVTINNVYVQ
jgi:hypothetical protein